jgi:hypothetical protein
MFDGAYVCDMNFDNSYLCMEMGEINNITPIVPKLNVILNHIHLVANFEHD